MASRILIVDDDPHIRDVLAYALTQAGMETSLAADGAAALAAFERDGADLVILDVGLPELDGLEVCRRLRKRTDVPILFVSARSDEIDRVVGLELGGDDYVAKPFSPRELVARVNAILKRTQRPQPEEEEAPQGILRRGRLRLDAPRFLASYGDADIPLTALEFAILGALARRSGLVLSRSQIMISAYGPSIHVSDRTIDSHIRNIRAKLAAAGAGDAIETVHAVGFRLRPLEE